MRTGLWVALTVGALLALAYAPPQIIAVGVVGLIIVGPIVAIIRLSDPRNRAKNILTYLAFVLLLALLGYCAHNPNRDDEPPPGPGYRGMD